MASVSPMSRSWLDGASGDRYCAMQLFTMMSQACFAIIFAAAAVGWMPSVVYALASWPAKSG
jgi:hypothetical protein